MDKARFLRDTPLFSSCSDDVIASIADVAKVRQFDEGDTILREDSQSTMGFYVLIEGTVSAARGSRRLADFTPGDYFGEIALLLDDSPRTATVAATSDVKVLALTRWDFKALLETNPGIAVELVGVLAERLARSDRMLAD
jgi:CRP-like cAMP-binding protein